MTSTNDPYNSAVAAELKRLISATSHQKLSQTTGIPETTISQYADGQIDIVVEDLRLLADALHVDIAEILRAGDQIEL